MSTLTNNTVADTYLDLIHAANNGQGVNSGQTVYLEDGRGDSIPIAIQGSDGNTGNRLILGGGKFTSEVTDSLTLSASNIVAYASGGNGSVDIKGDTVSVAATGLSLTFGSLPEAGGGVLTTSPDTGHSTLLWHGSGGVDEKVLTQSYELLDDSGGDAVLDSTDAMVTEIRLTETAAVDITLPTGTPGQRKTIILTANAGPAPTVTINTNLVTWTALSTGSCQLVKGNSSWIILTDSES